MALNIRFQMSIYLSVLVTFSSTFYRKRVYATYEYSVHRQRTERNAVFLTRHTYWLCGPGEKVLERIIVLPLTKGVRRGLEVLLSFGRTTAEDCARLSVLVSLSTYNIYRAE